MSRTDTWRQKVYDAETAWRSSHLTAGDQRPLMITIDDAKPILDSLADRFGVPRVEIEVNRRLRQWAGWYRKHGTTENYYQPLIEVRKPIFQYKTMLHEFAHHLDAMRGDNDGKGHGGSFAQAMLDVVGWNLGEEPMVDLMRSYENHGVPIGAEETRKVVARARDGVRRRQERHGLVEDAWCVRLTHERFGARWVEQDKLSTDAYLSRAGVWKRKSTAEKVLAEAELINWQGEVVKVRARLDTLESNRWWAIEVIE